MSDLGRNTTINGFEIYHKGNHGGEHNPHPQYILKKAGSTNNAKTLVNKWAKIASVTIESRYKAISTIINVLGGLSGTSNPPFAKIAFRVVQNELATVPLVNVILLESQRFTTEDVKCVITQNNQYLTVVELYLKNNFSYEQYIIQVEQENNNGVLFETFTLSDFLDDLPTGTVIGSKVLAENTMSYVRVYKTTDLDIPANVPTKIIYEGDTKTDRLSNYNYGTFTAFEKGVYNVFASIKTTPNNGYIRLMLYINGVFKTTIAAATGNATFDNTIIGNIFVELNRLDRLEIYVLTNVPLTIKNSGSDSVMVVTRIS